jgi:hypothetical protein
MGDISEDMLVQKDCPVSEGWKQFPIRLEVYRYLKN